MQSTDIAGDGLAYPVDPAVYRNLLSVRGYTHERPDEYNVQYGASVSQELPGAINLTVGYTGSRGRDMFLRGVANTLDNVTRVRPVAVGRPGRLQDVRLPRRPGHQRQRDHAAAARRATTRCRSARPAASAPASPAACSISTRATRGRPRARTKRRRRRTRSTTTPSSART